VNWTQLPDEFWSGVVLLLDINSIINLSQCSKKFFSLVPQILENDVLYELEAEDNFDQCYVDDFAESYIDEVEDGFEERYCDEFAEELLVDEFSESFVNEVEDGFEESFVDEVEDGFEESFVDEVEDGCTHLTVEELCRSVQNLGLRKEKK